MTHLKKLIPALAPAFLPFFATPAHAVGPLEDPYVEEGEWELEYTGVRSVDRKADRDDAEAHEFEIGYGVAEHWKPSISVAYAKEPGEDLNFEGLEFANKIQLNERGEDFVDAGIMLNYVWVKGHSPDELEAKLLLAKDFQDTSHTLNVVLSKEVGEGNHTGAEGSLTWSSRYTSLSEYFEPGFELDSNFGKLERMHGFTRNQDHSIGPAVYGHLPLKFGNWGLGLVYRVGYLFGFTPAAAAGQAFAQLEYEIHF